MNVRQIIYLATLFAASLLFLFGLLGLSHPRSARRGMIMAAFGMLIAVLGTLLHQRIVSYEWIIGGLVVGTIIGIPMGLWIPMTKMPERIALSHAFGGLAVALVGVAEYYNYHNELSSFNMGAIGFEVLLGTVTFTGSLIAFGKLQGILSGRPQTFRGQNLMNFILLGVALLILIFLVVQPTQQAVFYALTSIGLLLGVLLVLPIGGADMPVVICLLNSYAGLAAAATGFALNNPVLIVCGSLDGGSGFILALIMSKAMNRSFQNVIFGAFGAEVHEPKSADAGGAPIREGTPEDAAELLKIANSVIIVPGYGMAVAQAQHAACDLAAILEKNGTPVRYAIHPVAGRMPGHMNVLLAEANVPYDQLFELEAINDDFPRTDVSIVVGANDVVNPAARNTPGSPIFGMPILNVDQSKAVIVLKRSMNPGFAGIENELFVLPNTMMVFGDAKTTLTKITAAMKQE
ncbi:MAG: NAD(P)(+) transhydrogenase (Re/Si-specific) subunit beta [Verrucomicrobia bacterium]|nr:NAD(P)(+) transhydrogenase (Re/Si-specific) subunit beta [Verrucomicrobiota bacterium]